MDSNANLIPSHWPADPREKMTGAEMQAAARYLFQTKGFLADAEAAEKYFAGAVSLPQDLLADASRASSEPFFTDWLDEQVERLLAFAPKNGWLCLPDASNAGALDLETLADWLRQHLPETRLLADPELSLGRTPFYLDAWGLGAARWRGVYALGPELAGKFPEAEQWPPELAALCAQVYPMTLPEAWRNKMPRD